jgi:sugar phosphate isomerase/epimerase
MMTDEVSADLETALELASAWGLEGVELRGIGEKRFPAVSDLASQRTPTLIRRWDMRVAAISPGLFKVPTPVPPPNETQILRWEDSIVLARHRDAEAVVAAHLEVLLPRSIQAAVELGAPTIVCFSFDRGHQEPAGVAPELVIEALRRAATEAGEAGLTLALEVEHVCWADVSSRARDIVERVGHPALGLNWDPANAYRAGEDRPFPDGYDRVRDLVRHVHYKQASILPDGTRGFTAEGAIDWQGQVEALMRDAYDGWITVEPHVRPKVEGSRSALARLRRYMEMAQ